MMRQYHGPPSLPPMSPLSPTHHHLRRLPHLLFLVFLFALTSCNSGVAAQSKSERRYPMLSSIPDTAFRCRGYAAGYYADPETDCQVYHMCDTLGKQYSYLCPNHTLFNQKFMVCDHWYMVDCPEATEYYHLNNHIGHVPDDEESRGGKENNIAISPFKPPLASSSPLKPIASSSSPRKPSLSPSSPVKSSGSSSSPLKPVLSSALPLKPSVSSTSPSRNSSPSSSTAPIKPPVASTSPLKPFLSPSTTPFKLAVPSTSSDNPSSSPSKFPATPSSFSLRPSSPLSSTKPSLQSSVQRPPAPPPSSSLKPFVSPSPPPSKTPFSPSPLLPGTIAFSPSALPQNISFSPTSSSRGIPFSSSPPPAPPLNTPFFSSSSPKTPFPLSTSSPRTPFSPSPPPPKIPFSPFPPPGTPISPTNPSPSSAVSPSTPSLIPTASVSSPPPRTPTSRISLSPSLTVSPATLLKPAVSFSFPSFNSSHSLTASLSPPTLPFSPQQSPITLPTDFSSFLSSSLTPPATSSPLPRTQFPSAMLKPLHPPSVSTPSTLLVPPLPTQQAQQPVTHTVTHPDTQSVSLPLRPSSGQIGLPEFTEPLSRLLSLPRFPFSPSGPSNSVTQQSSPGGTGSSTNSSKSSSDGTISTDRRVVKSETSTDAAAIGNVNNRATHPALNEAETGSTSFGFTTTPAPEPVKQFTMMPANVARKPGNRLFFSSNRDSKPVFSPEDLQQIVFRPLVVRPLIKLRNIHSGSPEDAIEERDRNQDSPGGSSSTSVPDLSEVSRASSGVRFSSHPNSVDSSSFVTPRSLSSNTNSTSHQSVPTSLNNTSSSLRPLLSPAVNDLQPPLLPFSSISINPFLSPPRHAFSPIKRLKQEFPTPLSVPVRSRNTQFLVPGGAPMKFKSTSRGNRQFFIPSPVLTIHAPEALSVNRNTHRAESRIKSSGGSNIEGSEQKTEPDTSSDNHDHTHDDGISGMTMLFPAPPETRMEELKLNPECPRCHPAFLRPGQCRPCVLIK